MLSLTKRKDVDCLLKRPLSHQSRQKRPIRSKELQKPKILKKINTTLDNLEHKLYDIMEMKIDTKIDKKKSLKGNIEILQT